MYINTFARGQKKEKQNQITIRIIHNNMKFEGVLMNMMEAQCQRIKLRVEF